MLPADPTGRSLRCGLYAVRLGGVAVALGTCLALSTPTTAFADSTDSGSSSTSVGHSKRAVGAATPAHSRSAGKPAATVRMPIVRPSATVSSSSARVRASVADDGSLVIEQATTRVSALAAEVVPKVKGLKNSVTDLGSLQSALRDILNDIPRFLGSRYSVPNHPNLHWRDVVNQDLPSLNWLKGQAGTGWNVKDLFRWTAERDGHEIIQWMRTADPKLLDKAITDACKDGVPQNLADAGKALKEAIERQMKGRA